MDELQGFYYHETSTMARGRVRKLLKYPENTARHVNLWMYNKKRKLNDYKLECMCHSYTFWQRKTRKKYQKCILLSNLTWKKTEDTVKSWIRYVVIDWLFELHR